MPTSIISMCIDTLLIVTTFSSIDYCLSRQAFFVQFSISFFVASLVMTASIVFAGSQNEDSIIWRHRLSDEKKYRELSSFGLDFTFFDALNGLTTEIKEYDNAQRMWGKRHELTKGEQGVFKP